MSEERAGRPPDETDDLDQLLDDDEPIELDEGEEPESEGEVEPEPEGEAEAEKPRQPSRAERRIQALRRQAKEQGEELKRLRDAVLIRPAPQPVQPQVDPARQAELDRQEWEQVAQKPYEEQARYWATKSEQRMQQQMLRGQLETRDLLDRQSFQQIMRDRRLPARYGTEVENLLVQARQGGMNPSREWLLKAVIGDEVLTKKDRETEKQRIRGQRRVASQTTRTGTGARSTAANPGRRNQNTEADLDARLRGITLGEYTALYDR